VADNFILTSDKYDFDLTLPENQIPAPPIKATKQQLEEQLTQAESLFDQLQKGYVANSDRYASRSEFDKAKRETLLMIQETIPADLNRIAKWEEKYSVKSKDSAVGKPSVAIPASRVYELQQEYKDYQKIANNPPASVKRYLDAIKEVRNLQAKMDKAGTKESKMSDADKYLALAAAWQKVRPAITPEVEEFARKSVPTSINRYGEVLTISSTTKRDDRFTSAEVDSFFESNLNNAMKAAERQFSDVVVVSEDRWGRPLESTRIRNEKQSAELASFENRLNQVVGGTANAADVIQVGTGVSATPVTPVGGAPGQENRGAMTGRLGQQALTPQAAAQDRQFAGARPIETPRVATETVGDFRGAMTGQLEAGLGARGAVRPPTDGAGTGTGTGAGSGTGRAGRGGAGAGAAGGAAGAATIDGKRAGLNWEDNIRKYFPKQAWLLDEVDRGSNADLFDLLKEYSVPRPLTQEEIAIFAARLENTGYYKGLASSGKIRQIKSVVGDIGFDTTDFTQFVNRAINLGWEGDRLAQETYREVFSTNPDGSYINPVAAQRALKSNDYLGLAKVSREYFNPVGTDAANTRIVRVLTGEQNSEDFVRQERELAKQRYAHLAPLIDQGLSLEDIASNYKRTAAEILERDINSIDMSQADYEVALKFGEEGKQRVMTNGEWERLLRTDAKYGWDKTENAKAEARSLANTVVQAFGRII
jgi:hypothetical protein